MALNLLLKATTRIFPILSYCSARDGSRLLWLSSSLTAHCIHSAVCLRALQTQSREQETLAQERQDMLRQNEQQLKRVRQMLGHEQHVADPDHEPAWKRRRRS